ncbi:anti-sigma factor [Pseudalkalibacillus decolorationis]|uniref:anti-sigma factor n=1 Tax=Pseudalkalibacillus decolorationis TaxID=163879 RepID=UPI002147ECE1|nr:anti-sigma factor [Pseudalkalibacillus decolorationis]
MSDDFKNKLEAYNNGKLTKEEKIEFENELDKMEVYQSHLNNLMDEQGKAEENENNNEKGKKQKQLVKRGKWRARLQNALTALAIILIIMVVCISITVTYFTWGEPDRFKIYTDVIQAGVATTKPNITIGSSGTNIGFLTMKYDAELRKWIGGEHETVGELHSSFLFGPSTEIPNDIHQQPYFIYPEQQHMYDSPDGFDQLEHLPEGTVAELFVSLSDYYETNEVLQKFVGKNMRPTWFAVDTGVNNEDEIGPIGFPYEGYHFKADYDISKKEGDSLLISEDTEQSRSTKMFDDGEKRNKEFFEALILMEEYYSIANTFLWASSKEKLSEKINYIDENGTRIYGVVVTGPSKELLKLKEEDWIGSSAISEKRLWNWDDIVN